MDFKTRLSEVAKKATNLPPQPSPTEPTTIPFSTYAEHVVTEINPGQCKPWSYHDRTPANLTPQTCKPLLQSIQEEGRNQIPIIVRPIDHPNLLYEIIAGVRRHWCVSHLIRHAHPDTKLFAIVRSDLSDEEAFRLGDLENRHRQDISAYERAHAYANAIPHIYPSWYALSQSLQISRQAIGRYKILTELPDSILKAFASPHEISTRHAEEIHRALKDPNRTDDILKRAARLHRKQQHLLDKSQPTRSATDVTQRLLLPPRPPRNDETKLFKTPDDHLLATLKTNVVDEQTLTRVTFTTHPYAQTLLDDLVAKLSTPT